MFSRPKGRRVKNYNEIQEHNALSSQQYEEEKNV